MMPREPVGIVYAGGAVDYGDLDRTHLWRVALERALPEWEVFCPICQNAGDEDDLSIMNRNIRALRAADRGVFMLDGLFSVGTPIEVLDMVKRGPARVCIIHPDRPGLFVRRWIAAGVTVVGSLEEAMAWLVTGLSPISSPH